MAVYRLAAIDKMQGTGLERRDTAKGWQGRRREGKVGEGWETQEFDANVDQRSTDTCK
jgi:hypothetical protein